MLQDDESWAGQVWKRKREKKDTRAYKIINFGNTNLKKNVEDYQFALEEESWRNRAGEDRGINGAMNS